MRSPSFFVARPGKPARRALAAFGLAAAFPLAAQAQAAVECEYRNPDYPNWNFQRSCRVNTVTDGDRVTTIANVANGSTLTIVQEGTNAAPRFVVNGHAATRLENGASLCFLTIDDEETICIHGAEGLAASLAPADPADPTATNEPASTANATAADPVETAPGGVLGGGETGQCLTWLADEAGEGLIAQGPCTRRTNCAEVEGEGGQSCLVDIIWESGRETVITSQAGVYTLNGAVAAPRADGCLADEGAGLNFCFSQAAMTEAAYPALALPPAPDPTVAPVTATVATGEAVPEATQSAPKAAEGDRCSFLRDDVEVSSWACTETVACDDPVCSVTYAFETGTSVTLDTADGMVMLMNGAKADPAPWAAGAGVEVTRPGAPYTFRFTPGRVAAEAE